jgi:DNA-binding response OmpR family regulator
MDDARRRRRVVVFNASEDTVDMLTTFFDVLGLDATGETWPARDPLSLEVVQDFVRRHQPDVIVFDVSFPYEHNWTRYCEFRQADGVRDIPIVLTTTNKNALHDIVGTTAALEIVGKPYDLDELASAVKRVLSNVPYSSA